MARLTIHSVETAPEKAKPRVEAALKANGFLPNLIGVLANSPEALAFYQEVGKLNGETSLTPGERECRFSPPKATKAASAWPATPNSPRLKNC